MNGQQSFREYQKVSYHGKPKQWQSYNWQNRGHWGHHGHHHHSRSPFPGILLFFLAIFIFSKLWWLIFLVPVLIFLFVGSRAWRAGAWDGCESPRTIRVEAGKRKNDEFYGDDEYFDDKPKRQNDRDYEIV